MEKHFESLPTQPHPPEVNNTNVPPGLEEYQTYSVHHRWKEQSPCQSQGCPGRICFQVVQAGRERWRAGQNSELGKAVCWVTQLLGGLSQGAMQGRPELLLQLMSFIGNTCSWGALRREFVVTYFYMATLPSAWARYLPEDLTRSLRYETNQSYTALYSYPP